MVMVKALQTPVDSRPVHPDDKALTHRTPASRRVLSYLRIPPFELGAGESHCMGQVRNRQLPMGLEQFHPVPQVRQAVSEDRNRPTHELNDLGVGEVLAEKGSLGLQVVLQAHGKHPAQLSDLFSDLARRQPQAYQPIDLRLNVRQAEEPRIHGNGLANLRHGEVQRLKQTDPWYQFTLHRPDEECWYSEHQLRQVATCEVQFLLQKSPHWLQLLLDAAHQDRGATSAHLTNLCRRQPKVA
mmetsp:Transcript_80000/g.224778  ORF Transcript_80000/g.224778 Transcript_80000/m.224778 type:complete len:241 (+) Transcript_80000:51-773(+)